MNHEKATLLRSVGLLILRLGVGGYMLTHGIGKLQMLIGGQFEDFGDPIGLGNAASLVLMTFAEFGCALLIMVGLMTRLAAVPLVIGLGVAAFVVHGGDPWTMSGQGASKEPALLFLIPFLALLFTGPGQLALDALVWRRRGAKVKAEAEA